jgi:hypothetical protein
VYTHVYSEYSQYTMVARTRDRTTIHIYAGIRGTLDDSCIRGLRV